MDLTAVRVEKPDDLNVIIGQGHFITLAEDEQPVEAFAAQCADPVGFQYSDDDGCGLRRRVDIR